MGLYKQITILFEKCNQNASKNARALMFSETWYVLPCITTGIICTGKRKKKWSVVCYIDSRCRMDDIEDNTTLRRGKPGLIGSY